MQNPVAEKWSETSQRVGSLLVKCFLVNSLAINHSPGRKCTISLLNHQHYILGRIVELQTLKGIGIRGIAILKSMLCNK